MSAPIRTLMFASANDPVRSLKAIALGATEGVQWRSGGRIPGSPAVKLRARSRPAEATGQP